MPRQLSLDPAVEAQVERRLKEHFTRLTYPDVEQATHWSLSVWGGELRFRYLMPYFAGRLELEAEDRVSERPSSETDAARAKRRPRVLISGMGSGGEMIAARNLGFGEIHGTEVDAFYVTLVAQRLARHPGFFPMPVDGRNVPYAEGSFDVVVSGHIVEHTADPAAYVAEHPRVLQPGGYFLIEFPTRFHTRELHTGLPSLEWLPDRWRHRLLRGVGWSFPGFSEATRKNARTIIETGLKQVSFGRIRRWAAASGTPAKLIAEGRPEPGVVYGLFQRSL